MMTTDGRPESLEWCNFAAQTRAVCRFGGLIKNPGEIDLLGFSRLLAVNTDGSNPKLLGQPATAYELTIRNVDAAVIDWLTQSDGTVLLERLYVPEEGKWGRTSSGRSGGSVSIASM